MALGPRVLESEPLVTTHAWEDRGVGKAPFRAVACITCPPQTMMEQNPQAYNNACQEAAHAARKFGVTLRTCNVCGQSLLINYVIKDANGKYFIVGSDCVDRTGDSRLMSQVDNNERLRKKAIRKQLADAKREAAIQKAKQELEAQRHRNGGLTDVEIRQKKEKEEQEAEERRYQMANKWLLDFLNTITYDSAFVSDMVYTLSRKTLVDELSDRQLSVLCSIYTKGYRGAAKEQREKDFYSKVENTHL